MKTDSPVRVLLVDHRRMIRIALGAVLNAENEFLAVGHAQSGPDAVALLQQAQPDVAICTAELAGLSAIETCQQIRQVAPDVKTVVLAGDCDPVLIERAVLAGVSGIITGDASTTGFIAALRRVMAGEIVVPAPQVPVLLQRLTHRRHESDALLHRFMALTRREREVLQLVVDGHNYAAVATELYISPQTVRRHVHNLLTKLEAQSCVEAAARCVSEGLMSVSQPACKKAG